MAKSIFGRNSSLTKGEERKGFCYEVGEEAKKTAEGINKESSCAYWQGCLWNMQLTMKIRNKGEDLIILP